METTSGMIRLPRSVILFAIGLALLTSLPYLVGAAAPPGLTYTGAPVLPNGTSVDYYSHLAKMWQGRHGDFAYHLLFTHEDHTGLPLVQGFYVLLGAVSPFDLPVTYHLARAVLTAVMVLAIYAVGVRLFEKPYERWVFLIFAVLVSGVSWLLLIADPVQAQQVAPIEFWLIDAYNLAGALFMPHFAAAVALQALALLAFWDRRMMLLTVILAGLAILQPYFLVLSGPLFALITLRQVILSRKISGFRAALWLILPLGVQTVLTVYQFAATQSDPVWRSFTAQNVTASPPPIYYVLGYLPLLLPVAIGWRGFAAKRGDSHWWMIGWWVLLVIALLYAPLPTQRRYLIGVQTPLAALAALGWTYATQRIKRPRQMMITVVYVVIAALPLFMLWFGNLANIATHPDDLYTNGYDQQAYALLNTESSPSDTILTTFDWSGEGSGGRVVAGTGHRVFIGHWIETVDFDAKIEQVRRFYDPSETDAWRCEFLRTAGIVYVWYDRYAQAIGGWRPGDAPYIEPVRATEMLTLFRFNAAGCGLP
ncbi:MAG: hypothetical protein U0670_19890 [Anaerolineae bacterium]